VRVPTDGMLGHDNICIGSDGHLYFEGPQGTLDSYQIVDGKLKKLRSFTIPAIPAPAGSTTTTAVCGLQSYQDGDQRLACLSHHLTGVGNASSSVMQLMSFNASDGQSKVMLRIEGFNGKLLVRSDSGAIACVVVA